MADKQEELLKFIKNVAWKLIFQAQFPDDEFKELKREYFDRFRTEIGIPKDKEIAEKAMEHMLKIRYFKNKDDVQRILNLEFFSKNIFNPEDYIDKYERLDSKPDLDIKLLRDKEYEAQKFSELEERVIKERTNDIDKVVKEKLDAYESIYSKLELENEIPEPEGVGIDTTVQYDPWWKKLGLKEDPFPDTNGLGNIPSSIYERIVIKTEIYERYMYYVNNIPKDLFKNIVFFGQYGCGKTTFFQYLKGPLVKAHIDPIMITISSEPDYQNFLINFKKKLSRELVKIYENLTGENIDDRLELLNIDDQVIQVFKLIKDTGRNSGFIIFIDDIYKPPAYEKISLMFLNNLQNFKSVLTQELGSFDIGFFISAPIEWKSILSNNQAYSGSISDEEEMPFPNVEQARSMFNERLSAFASDQSKYREVTSQFALQVYQTLKSKNAWTFRQFIHECLNRFKSGNFDILTSNPVSIDNNSLRTIKQALERNQRLNDGLNDILNSDISPRNKAECVELLVQIFNQKGFPEDSELYQKKRFYLNLLRKAGLIVKRRENNDKTIWVVSKDLIDFDIAIFGKFSYYLEDYFIRLFEGKLEIKKNEPSVGAGSQFTLLQDLIERIKNNKNNSLSHILPLLESTLEVHKKIISDIDSMSDTITFDKVAEKCRESIRTLSNAVSTHTGLVVSSSQGDTLDFWNDFWYYPDSLGVFLKLARTPPTSELSKVYLFSAYDTAFKDITSFLANQIDRSAVFVIPIQGLTNSEIKSFNDARELTCTGEYFKAVDEISKLVENKLREFLYGVFMLQYGERNNRIQRIPIHLHEGTINKHETSDDRQGFGYSRNELTNLNRQDYSGIITGQQQFNDIGHENWYRTFSKIFKGWDIVRTRSYFNKFIQFNIRGTHFKRDAFTPTIQSDINFFITSSLTLLVRMNESFFTLLNNTKKKQISGSTDMEYYFPLDENNSSFLKQVRVSSDNRQRLVETFKRSKTNTIDLSSPTDIENKYGMSYKEVFAIVVDLISTNPEDTHFRNTRKCPFVTLKT